MGNNLNLTQMLNLPASVSCPRCGEETTTWFDEYDIECGNPNPSPGEWELNVNCTHCDARFTIYATIGVTDCEVST